MPRCLVGYVIGIVLNNLLGLIIYIPVKTEEDLARAMKTKNPIIIPGL